LLRIRTVNPAFWIDEKVATLPYSARLLFIGLWCVADDAGYMKWRPREIAAELFRYESPRKREARFGRDAGRLVQLELIQVLDCGHARVPNLRRYQHFAGATRQVRTTEREHRQDCEGQAVAPYRDQASDPIPADPRGSPRIPADPRLGIGIGIGKGRKDRDNDGKETFDARAYDAQVAAIARRRGL
jgi:hypothetical protein